MDEIIFFIGPFFLDVPLAPWSAFMHSPLKIKNKNVWLSELLNIILLIKTFFDLCLFILYNVFWVRRVFPKSGFLLVWKGDH